MIYVAWQGHSPESRAFAESLRAAIVEIHGSEKAGAIALGLTPQKLSQQLAGREPFNAWRAASTPLIVRWMAIHAKAMGCSLLTKDEKDLILGCVGIGRRKMARFLDIPSGQSERQRA